MAKFISISEFVSGQLNQLLEGKTALRVVVATYNTVYGYSNGEVQTGKAGLTARVCTGGSFPSPIAMGMLMSNDWQMQDMAMRSMSEDAEAGQSEVEDSIQLPPAEDDTPLMLIMYAGLSAWRPVFDYIERVLKKKPDTMVVVVCCDCQSVEKHHRLDPMLDDGRLKAVVWSDACGGRDSMGDMLNAIIKRWPGESAPARADERKAEASTEETTDGSATDDAPSPNTFGKITGKIRIDQVRDGTKYKGEIEIVGLKLAYEITFSVPIPKLGEHLSTFKDAKPTPQQLREIFQIKVSRDSKEVDLDDGMFAFLFPLVVETACEFHDNPQTRDSNRGFLGMGLRGEGAFGPLGPLGMVSSVSIGMSHGFAFSDVPELRTLLEKFK